MNTSKSLDQILIDFLKEDDDGNVNLAKARSAIVEAVEGLIPEYRDNTTRESLSFVMPPLPEYDDHVSVGYNQAVDDMLQAIKEWQ